jgi:CheY-like chemotaxis protein
MAQKERANGAPAGSTYKMLNENDPEVLRTRVLLAEDDREMRSLLAQTLRDEGYEVVEAADGEEAARYLDIESTDGGPATAVDMVVADVRMPAASGLDLLADLRNFDWVTGVVLISAFADQSVHDEARRLGASALLAKPFSLEHFLDVVRDVAPPQWGVAPT